MSAKILTSTENMPYDDWLEWRRRGIGGSDASVVCGINRYKSPMKLWLDKTDQLPIPESGEAAYWGTKLEALVRRINTYPHAFFVISYLIFRNYKTIINLFKVNMTRRKYEKMSILFSDIAD